MDRSPNLIARRFSVAVFLSLILLTPSTGATAQQPAGSVSEERDRGIQLYKLGEFKQATESLRAAVKKNKEDADAWYYLGLARARGDDQKNAR